MKQPKRIGEIVKNHIFTADFCDFPYFCGTEENEHESHELLGVFYLSRIREFCIIWKLNAVGIAKRSRLSPAGRYANSGGESVTANLCHVRLWTIRSRCDSITKKSAKSALICEICVSRSDLKTSVKSVWLFYQELENFCDFPYFCGTEENEHLTFSPHRILPVILNYSLIP